MIDLPESPLERAKRLSREFVSIDEILCITERVPWSPRDRDGAEGGDAKAAPVLQDRQARAEGIAR